MFDANQSILLIVDIQTRLTEKVYESTMVVDNTLRLIKAAKILEMPILVTEQVPEKIGITVAPITKQLIHVERIAKKSFSCCGSEDFNRELKELKRQQIIVVGIEAHVCIIQTVIDLLKQSYQVQVVVDAVSSRNPMDKQFALNRMEDKGCQLTTMETVITELLKTADHPNFSEILSLIK